MSIQSAHLPGYNAALASSLRDGPIRGLSSAYKQLGASERPVLLIWVRSNRLPAPTCQWHRTHTRVLTYYFGRALSSEGYCR